MVTKQDLDEAVASATAAMMRRVSLQDVEIKAIAQSIHVNAVLALEAPSPKQDTSVGILEFQAEDEEGEAISEYAFDGERLRLEDWEVPEREILIQDFLATCEESMVVIFKAYSRGFLLRKFLADEKLRGRPDATYTQLRSIEPLVIGFQALARGVSSRRRHLSIVRAVDNVIFSVVALQSFLRGSLTRQRISEMRRSLKNSLQTVIALQAVLQGFLLRRQGHALSQACIGGTKYFLALQAMLRGNAARVRHANIVQSLKDCTFWIISLQSHLRGALIHRETGNVQKSLDWNVQAVIAFQVILRGTLLHLRSVPSQVFISPLPVALWDIQWQCSSSGRKPSTSPYFKC